MTPDPQREAELSLAAFLLEDRRDRFLQLLASKVGRQKLRARLAHFPDLDPSVCVPIRSSDQSATAIAALLRSAGANLTCFVVAERSVLDGRSMPLTDALDAVVGRGSGALISCVPGRLGYYEGEDPGTRWLLKANAT